MLIKRKSQDAARTRLAGLAGGLTSGVMDRRTFLARSGLTAAGAIAVGALTLDPAPRYLGDDEEGEAAVLVSPPLTARS